MNSCHVVRPSFGQRPSRSRRCHKDGDDRAAPDDPQESLAATRKSASRRGMAIEAHKLKGKWVLLRSDEPGFR